MNAPNTLHRCVLVLSSILLFTLLVGCDNSSEEATPRELEPGVWGSDEARLEIRDTGGKITFFCAEGNLAGKILVNQSGEFEVPGTMVTGPVVYPSRPVKFTGMIAGDELTLSIVYTDTSENFGVFKLKRGFDSNVIYICVC